MLDAKNPQMGGAEHQYKVPNKAGDGKPRQADILAKYPNMAMPPADLVKYRAAARLGDGPNEDYSKIVSEIKAAQ